MENAQYYFDTGPLLGFAICTNGPKLLRDRYQGRAWAVTEVFDDLKGLQHNSAPELADAAKLALQRFTWIKRVEVDDLATLQRAEEIRVQIQAFSDNPSNKAGHRRQDWGESVTLAHVEKVKTAIVVALNENAATRVANNLSIHTINVVAILQAMCDDKLFTKKHAWKKYQEITRVTDAGAVVHGPQDF